MHSCSVYSLSLTLAGMQYINNTSTHCYLGFFCLQKTPLHYAAMHGDLSVVKHLVEHLVKQEAPAITKKEYVNSKDTDEVGSSFIL